jgi:hypothetical protein
LASEFDKPHEDGRSTPHFQEEHREEAGGYRIFYLGPADIAVLERWGSRSIRDTFAGLGYFAFVSAVANFIRTGAKEDYEIMLNSIERDLECFYLLPPNLAFYLSDFVCGRNREPSDCGFELARQKERPGMLRHVMVTPETEKAGLDCPRLAIQFPLLVFDAAIGEFGGAAAAKEQIREFLCSDEGAGWGDSVLKLGQIDPFLFVGDWGDLFGLQRFGDVLRAFVRERASAHAVQHSATPMRVAFRLALPDEAPLLPHVVNSMVAAVERRIGHDNPGRNVSKGTRFRALVDEFVSDPGDLERCHRNQSLSKSERAGALVLDIVCTLSVPGRDIGLFQPMLEELYDSDNGHWFPLAIATSLYDAVLEGNKQAIVLVGAVIELTRCDYKARIELDAVFESWREMARAPVQKSSPSLWR